MGYGVCRARVQDFEAGFQRVIMDLVFRSSVGRGTPCCDDGTKVALPNWLCKLQKIWFLPEALLMEP